MDFIQFLINGVGKFIIELLHYGAFPATIIIVVYLFKDEIRALLSKVKKFKGGNFELSLEEIKEITIAKTVSTGTIFEINRNNYDYDNYLNLIYIFGLTHVYMLAGPSCNLDEDDTKRSMEIVKKVYNKLKEEDYDRKGLEIYKDFLGNRKK